MTNGQQTIGGVAQLKDCKQGMPLLLQHKKILIAAAVV
jgi:hypothetical protein